MPWYRRLESKPRKKHNLDRPYGTWLCRDGREVLFSRRYEPMWQRMPGCSATPADPLERVKPTSQTYLWGPGPTTMRQSIAAGRAALRSWGVPA
jgi:hypothetical protein